MKKEETIKRNITLAFDFIKYLIKNPKVINNIPDNCEVNFIQKDVPFRIKSSYKRSKLFKVKNDFDEIK